MIGDGSERISLRSSQEQTGRSREFLSTTKPISTSHQQMLDALGWQLDTLDEFHSLAGTLGGDQLGRALWLCHRQLATLQAASSAIYQELIDRFKDTDELETLDPQAEADLIRRFGSPLTVCGCED